MPTPPEKSDGAFRTIREVADWLGVPTHVLRFWESKFDQIAPVKGAGGRRYYRPEDMQLLGGIKVMLHDQGLTIRAVGQKIETDGAEPVMALSPELDMPEGPPTRTRRVIRQGDDSDKARVSAKDAPAPVKLPTAQPAGAAPTPPAPTPADPAPLPADPAPVIRPEPETPPADLLPAQPDTPAEDPADHAPAPDAPPTEAPDPDRDTDESEAQAPDAGRPLPQAPDDAAPLPEAADPIDPPAPADAPQPVHDAAPASPEPSTPDEAPEEPAAADSPPPTPAAISEGLPHPIQRALELALQAGVLAPADKLRLRRVIRRYRALAEEISDDLAIDTAD